MKTQRIGLATEVLLCLVLLNGCAKVTAVNLNDPSAPKGIPYYLPKPYLFVSKNIRYIPTLTVGLTEVVAAPPAGQNSGDDSSKSSNKQPSSNNNDNSQQGTKKGSASGVGHSGASDGGSQHEASHTTLRDNPLDDPAVARFARHAEDVIFAADVPQAALPPIEPVQDVHASPPDATVKQPADNDKEAKPDQSKPSATQPSSSQVDGPPNVIPVPATSIPDEMHPETFFTYQIVYLPDLTQKYGLRVSGGCGEMRQTMNLVNGWMYTGGGPMYFNDSTVSQDITSVGSAVGSIAGAVAEAINPVSALTGGKTAGTQGQQKDASNAPTNSSLSTGTFNNYAELYVYEPNLIPAGRGEGACVKWKLLKGFPLSFPREYTSVSSSDASPPPPDATSWNDQTYGQLASTLKGKNFPSGDQNYQITSIGFGPKGADVTLNPTPSANVSQQVTSDLRAFINQAGKQSQPKNTDAVVSTTSITIK